MLEVFTRITSEPFNFDDIKPLMKENLINFSEDELEVLYEKSINYSLKTGVVKISSDDELESYQLIQPAEEHILTKFHQVYIY